MTATETPGGFVGLAGQSVLYSLGPVTQKAVGVLLLPALARLLDRGEFGRLEVLSTVATSVTAIAVLGLDVVTTRRYADVDDAGRSRTFGTWLAIAMAVGSGVVLVALAVAGPLSRALFDDGRASGALVLAAVFALVDLAQIVGLTALRNEGRARAYAAVASGAAVLNGVAVGWLAAVHRDENAVMVGICVAAGAGGLAAVIVARRLVLARPSTTEARVLLVAAAPLVPGLLLTWGGDLANRTILLAAAGSTEVAELSVAIRFGTVGLLLVSGFQLAWHPRAYAMAATDAGRRRLGQDGTAILVAVALLTALLAAASPELLRLVAGSRYSGALEAVGIALLVPIPTALLLVATLPAAIANRMRELGLATAIGAAATIVLTVALVEPFGAVGAASAQAGGPLLGATVALARAGRTGARLPHDWVRVATVVAGAVAVTLLSTSAEAGDAVVVHVVAVACLAAVVVALEGRALVGLLSRLLRRTPA